MKKLFVYANNYVQNSDWSMMALLKFCLFSMGLLLGIYLPEKKRKPAAVTAFCVFIATYIPLMADFIGSIRQYRQEHKDASL
ncbi:MAG: permease of phosphate ABC transporter [Negativibacillus sp.]